MDLEWLAGRKTSINELVEFRGRYVIHRYSFPDKDACDFHATGPGGFRQVVFDVRGVDVEAVIDQLRALIDHHRGTDER